MYFNHSVLNWEHSQSLWLGEWFYMSVYSWIWEWGGSLKRELFRKSWSLKHFWPALTWEAGAACRTGKWITLSSNSSEWVPSTSFQDLEHFNRRKCWSSLHSCFANFQEADFGFKMEHWSFLFCLYVFLKNLQLSFVFCFCFLFGGYMGKSFWTLSFVNSHCVPVKSLFFPNVVSYIFIKPHHIFTVKILKGCFQVGRLMKF